MAPTGREPHSGLSKTGSISRPYTISATPLPATDGANPSFLTQGIDGNFYGATGPNPPPHQRFVSHEPHRVCSKALHVFDPKTQPDGSGVFGMVQAPDGNFYGTTVAGEQPKPFNTVFRFNPVTSQNTILHGFNSPNINLPNVAASGLTLASDGNLYGFASGQHSLPRHNVRQLSPDRPCFLDPIFRRRFHSGFRR